MIIPLTEISINARRNSPGAIFPNLRTSLITYSIVHIHMIKQEEKY